MRLPQLISPGTNLTQWSRDLEAYLRSITPRSSGSVRVSQGPNGSTFATPSQNICQSSATSAAPFQCTLIPQTNDDGSPNGNKVAVELNSTLFTSLIPLTEFSGITGLCDPTDSTPFTLDLDGPADTSNYTSPNGNPDDYVILEIKFQDDGITIDTVAIETKGNGSSVHPTYDAWDDSGDALVAQSTATPPKQTYARIVLATYQDGELQQNVMGNLVMQNMCINGQPALYPVPY
jgi:hypothetical protein